MATDDGGGDRDDGAPDEPRDGWSALGHLRHSVTREGSVNIPLRQAEDTWRSTIKRARLSHEPQRSRTTESEVTALSPRAKMASGLGTTTASSGNGQRWAQSSMGARRRPELETGASRKKRTWAGPSEPSSLPMRSSAPSVSSTGW